MGRHLIFAHQPAKGVAAAQNCRSKAKDAACTAAELIAARDTLKGPEGKGIDQHHPIDFVRRQRTSGQQGKLDRNLIFDLQPGQGQQFLVLNAYREYDRLSKEGTFLVNPLPNHEITKCIAIPELGNNANDESKYGGKKGDRLASDHAENEQGSSQHIPGATLISVSSRASLKRSVSMTITLCVAVRLSQQARE